MNKCYGKDLIKVADSQVGYTEKASNKDLDDFSANAGKGNYTKYARDFKEYSGINVQGQPWCDVFVDDCFVKAFGVEKAKELLGGFSAYTPTSANNFKKNDAFYTDPKPYDIVFYKNSERINHTGIVYKVDSNYFYTIEGNTSSGPDVVPNGGAVYRKKFSLSLSKLAGFGRPAYDKQEFDIPATSVTPDSNEDDIKWMQENLNTLFENDNTFEPLVVDGSYGKKSKIAVVKFIKTYIDEDTTLDGSVFSTHYIRLLLAPKSRINVYSDIEDIKWMQAYLNIVFKDDKKFKPLIVDGSYGKKSKAAVVKFIKTYIDPKTKLAGDVFSLSMIVKITSL